jgi:hypothetical protein
MISPSIKSSGILGTSTLTFPKLIKPPEIESYLKEWRLAGVGITMHHNGYDVEEVGVANNIDLWGEDPNGGEYLICWYQLQDGNWYWYDGEWSDSDYPYGEKL